MTDQSRPPAAPATVDLADLRKAWTIADEQGDPSAKDVLALLDEIARLTAHPPAPAEQPIYGHAYVFDGGAGCGLTVMIYGAQVVKCGGLKSNHQPAPQTPMQRLMEHQRKDTHQWVADEDRRVLVCADCEIAFKDWEQMRESRAKLEPLPTPLMTDLERQLTQKLAEIDEVGTLEHARRHITCGQIIVSKDAEIERLQALNANQASMIDGYRVDETDHEREIERITQQLAEATEHRTFLAAGWQKAQAELVAQHAVVDAAQRADSCMWAFADTLRHQDDGGCLTILHEAIQALDAARAAQDEREIGEAGNRG